MTKYKHNISEYLKLLNEGKSYQDLADITGNGDKTVIYNWIKQNFILKNIFTAIPKKQTKGNTK
jgi:hypothetical protein